MDKENLQEEKKTYYKKCEYCGANLDPGEICDCKKEKPEVKLEEKSQKKTKKTTVKEEEKPEPREGQDDNGRYILTDSGKKVYPDDHSLDESSKGMSAKEMKNDLDSYKKIKENKEKAGMKISDEEEKFLQGKEREYNDQVAHEKAFDEYVQKRKERLNSAYVPYLRSLNTILEATEDRAKYLNHLNKYKELNESVLDPINKERCPDVFKNDKMIPSVRKFILDIINEFKKQVNFDFKIRRILMIGSSTGYQYSSNSDIDINFETDMTDDQVSQIWKIIPKGTLLPGTKKPVNVFLLKKGEEYNFDHAENVYDIINDKWLKKADKTHAQVPYSYVRDLSLFFMNGCELAISKYNRDVKEAKEYMSLDPNTMEISEKEKADAINRKIIELRNDVDAMRMAHHVIRSFSKEGFAGMPFRVNIEMVNQGDPRYAINNLIYKMCDRFGYFEKLDNAVEEGYKLIEELEKENDAN